MIALERETVRLLERVDLGRFCGVRFGVLRKSAEVCGGWKRGLRKSSNPLRERDNFRRGFAKVGGCLRKLIVLLAWMRKSSLVYDDIPQSALTIATVKQLGFLSD